MLAVLQQLTVPPTPPAPQVKNPEDAHPFLPLLIPALAKVSAEAADPELREVAGRAHALLQVRGRGREGGGGAAGWQSNAWPALPCARCAGALCLPSMRVQRLRGYWRALKSTACSCRRPPAPPQSIKEADDAQQREHAAHPTDAAAAEAALRAAVAAEAAGGGPVAGAASAAAGGGAAAEAVFAHVGAVASALVACHVHGTRSWEASTVPYLEPLLGGHAGATAVGHALQRWAAEQCGVADADEEEDAGGCWAWWRGSLMRMLVGQAGSVAEGGVGLLEGDREREGRGSHILESYCCAVPHALAPTHGPSFPWRGVMRARSPERARA